MTGMAELGEVLDEVVESAKRLLVAPAGSEPSSVSDVLTPLYESVLPWRDLGAARSGGAYMATERPYLRLDDFELNAPDYWRLQAPRLPSPRDVVVLWGTSTGEAGPEAWKLKGLLLEHVERLPLPPAPDIALTWTGWRVLA